MFYSKKTTNISFINLWRTLQRLNVANNIFPLQTIEKPFNNYDVEYINNIIRGKDKKLSETVFKELTKECVENIWFYFREILFLEDLEYGGKDPVHFDITLRICYMLYLYSKKKSFFILNPSVDELIALKLLWNYHRSIITDDLVILKGCEYEEPLFKEAAQLTAFMPVKLLIGGAQALVPGRGHIILINDDVYKEFPSNKFVTDDIDRKISNIKKIDTAYPTFFSFDDYYKVYAYILEKRNAVRFYLTLNDVLKTKEGQIFYYTSKAFIPQVTEKIFDTPDGALQDIYFI